MEDISPDKEFIQQHPQLCLCFMIQIMHKGALCAILLLFNGFEMGNVFNLKCRANNVVKE